VNVLVAMSGGVDSSVAAALLLEEGHDVTGVTLKLWGGASDSGCCSVSDVEDARRVAAQLGVPHYVFNFAEEFEDAVVTPYVEAYRAGRTPNPCVACNEHLKFGRLLARSLELGFDALATGHHVRRRVDPATGRPSLHRAADAAKDQSYVLALLGHAELADTRFPVGELTKAAVREQAAALGLRTAAKPESMDVCFITRGGRERFLDARDALLPGPVVDAATGAEVGRHGGVATVTIGQRRGLGVASTERRYVVDVRPESATVVLGRREDLLTDRIPVTGWRFADGTGPTVGSPVLVQASAHGTAVPATYAPDALALATPRARVAPGQVVAIYDGDRVLGGATAA
jgi:tRNA-specific 2-thiouridylase